jgi:hypothetical protein
MSSENPVCQQCERELSPEHVGPCPDCGHVGKLFRRTIIEPHISVSDNISVIPTYHSIRKYYSDNPKKAGMQTAFLVIGVLSGYAVSTFDPILGVFIGMIIGAFSFCMPPITKNQN